MTEKSTPRPTIKSPFWGRLVGFIWDLAVSISSLVIVPTGSFIAAALLIDDSPLCIPLATLFVMLGMFSFLFGVFWTFRGHR